MRSFFAALYKDVRLFLSGAGILAVLLPVLLLPALSLGMEDLTGAETLRSFPVAVRDEDGTVMSRSLISQLGNIDLFSKVTVIDGGVTDGEALAGGAAAVVTIPKDFFYQVYRMAECPVDVTLNSDMPVQSAVFEAIFRSVMGIIRANHASALGTYTYVYGELTDGLIRQMRRETGDRLAVDALGRQRVFTSLYPSDETGGPAAALTRRLAACVLGVLALFFAIGSAKTVPEELGLGVLPRLRACRLGVGGFAASKYLSALLLSLPALVPAALMTGLPFFRLLGLYALLLLTAFSVMLLLAALTSSAAAVQRWGSLLVLLSLALGGTLWPVSSLPAGLRALRYAALPRYASLALEGAAAGLDPAGILRLLCPLLPVCAGCLALSLPLLSRSRPARHTPLSSPVFSPRGQENAGSVGLPGRICLLTLSRIRFMTGGFAALAAFLAAALVCGVAGASAASGRATALRLGVCDLDRSDLSRELTEAIASAPGVVLEEVAPERAETALLTGSLEGILTVGAGYADALRSGGETPLELRASAASVTGQGAREIVAGAVMVQLRSCEAVADAGRLLGRELAPEEIPALRGAIADAAAALPELYRITRTSALAPADPFAPSPMAFAALAALFTLLTAAAFTASADARAVRRRLFALRGGRVMSALTDLLSLAALGLLTVFAVLLPAGPGPETVLPAVLTALCMAALSVAVTRFGAAEGRVDALAPLLAVLICLAGGCFLDLSALSPALEKLTALSPAGLAVRAFAGSVPAGALLAGETALFSLAAFKK